ncbi:mucin-1-like [Nilaparvata lugens]|uniref:mucin-1-like n=1 Tax=Nilaparvata lugens TaxID=108931 RepID=UPI00193E1A32|nr:mucin-1-like [Nilaparvata lugens]
MAQSQAQPCGTCRKDVVYTDKGLLCEGMCEQWFHTGCVAVSDERYAELQLDGETKWRCPTCDKEPLLSLFNDLKSLQASIYSISAKASHSTIESISSELKDFASRISLMNKLFSESIKETGKKCVEETSTSLDKSKLKKKRSRKVSKCKKELILKSKSSGEESNDLLTASFATHFMASNNFDEFNKSPTDFQFSSLIISSTPDVFDELDTHSKEVPSLDSPYLVQTKSPSDRQSNGQKSMSPILRNEHNFMPQGLPNEETSMSQSLPKEETSRPKTPSLLNEETLRPKTPSLLNEETFRLKTPSLLNEETFRSAGLPNFHSSISPAHSNELTANEYVSPTHSNELRLMSPIDLIEQSSSPAHSNEQSPSPAHSIEQSLSPAHSIERSLSPAHSIEQSLSPAHSIERSLSPAHSIEQSLSPAHSIERSLSPAHLIEQSLSPAHSNEQSPSPAHSIEQSLSPAHSIERSLSPAHSIEQSLSPAHSNAQSLSPAHSIEQSSSPAHSNAQSLSPAHSNAQSPSPAHSNQQSLSPAHSIEQSSSPAHSNAQSPSPAYSNPQSLSPAHSNAHSLSPAHSNAQSLSPAHSNAQSLSPAHSNAQSLSPAHSNKQAAVAMEYQVEDILDYKVVDDETLFLVKWRNCGMESSSWESREYLVNCSEAIYKYFRRSLENFERSSLNNLQQ